MGMSQKHSVYLLLVVLLILGLINRIWWLASACVVVFLTFEILYRWGQRTGYTTFIETMPPADPWAGEPLSSTTKLPLRATGHFLVGKSERRLILVSGECWQLPIGEIALMLEAAPGRFAYQFIDPAAIETTRFGQIWFGNSHEIAIEVAFQTDWIQADDQIKIGGQKWADMTDRLGRRITVLSFNSLDDAHQVWHNLNSV